MSNRQQRRHPTHPYLPILRPSGKRIPDKKESGVSGKKASNRRKLRKIVG